MKGEQNLPTENPLESSNYADQVESHDNVESHDSMEKDEEEENLWEQKKAVACARQCGDQTKTRSQMTKNMNRT